MRIPQIQISTTDIKMQYQTTDPIQKIEQPKASLHIEQPAAILEINTTRPQLNVDMSQFWSDVGLKSNKEIIQDSAQKGKQEALAGISRRVGEGRQMMDSAGKGQGASVIQSIAKQNHGPKRPGPIGIKFIPSYNSIKAHIEPGTTDVNITAQQPKIEANVNKPVHIYTPGSVSGTMVQRPNIEIDVLG